MTAKQLKAVFLLMLLLTGLCGGWRDENDLDEECPRIREILRNPQPERGGWSIG